jgi:hypothetical protein
LGHPAPGIGDRPTTCHHRNRQLLGNLNCGLRTVRLSGINLGSGKSFPEMWIATWNIYRLYRPEGMNEFVKEMDKYKVDLCVCKQLGVNGKKL